MSDHAQYPGRITSDDYWSCLWYVWIALTLFRPTKYHRGSELFSDCAKGSSCCIFSTRFWNRKSSAIFLLISVRCQRLSSLFGKEVNPILQMICHTYYVYARHSLATLRVQLMLLSLRRSSNCCNCSTILSSVRPYTSIWCLVYFLNGHLARRVQSWSFSCEIRGVLKDPTIRVSIGRVPCWWETRCRPCTPRLRVPHYNRSLYHTAK